MFRLDDDAVLSYLDTLEELPQGRLTFSDTALTRQVVRRADITGTEILGTYYVH